MMLIALLLVAGCGLRDDAVVQDDSFKFVSPEGKTSLQYRNPKDRTAIPEFFGDDVRGDKQITSAQFAGRIVVINVWAQWCGPCRGEIKDLVKLAAKNSAQGVDFLGLNVRESGKEAPRDFLIDNQVTYPNIFDPSLRVVAILGITTPVVPTTVILDRQRRIAAKFFRVVSHSDIQPILDMLAAEK